jgi:hypothetical protein
MLSSRKNKYKCVNSLRSRLKIFVLTNKMKAMIPSTIPKVHLIDSFMCHGVVFDQSDLVSLHTTCRIGQELKKTILLFTFSAFNDLLRFNGKTGEDLQIIVSDKLWSNEETPYIIDLGKEGPVFTTCRMQLSELIRSDDSCYSVDHLFPLSFVQRARKLRFDIADFGKASLQQNDMVNHAMKKAAAMYRYYQGLLELNISEEAAREKAGLKNESLLKMAFQASKTVNKTT